VIHTYMFNKGAVQALGDHFGFSYLFFWQPVIFEKNRLSPFEKSVLEKMERDYPGMGDFYRQSYATLREVGSKEHVTDLSRIFTDKSQSYYTDDAHIIESGNQVVVQAMLSEVQAAVEKLAAAPKAQ